MLAMNQPILQLQTGVTAAQYGSVVASPADQYNLKGGGNPI